jgi:hypothetical protein
LAVGLLRPVPGDLNLVGGFRYFGEREQYEVVMSSPADSPPIFALYGALRSGTTLVRLILGAHPEIHSAHENDFLLDHLRPGPDGLRLDAQALADDRIFRASGLSVPSARGGRAAFEAMLAEHRGDWQGPVVLVLHRELGRLLDLRPDARIIHLLRDPRDVARSSIGMGWAGTPWHGVRHWIRTEEDWDRHADRAPAVHRIRYEDLVRDPIPELTRLCAFLGLAYHPAMMDYVRTSTYSDIDPAMAEQWRRRMRPRDIALVEHRVGRLLAARGYAPSGHPVILPGPTERLRLRMVNRIGVWRMRIARYGVADPLVYGLAKRLRLGGLRRRFQRRLDDKHSAFLK